jgi:hypothetical protein
VAEECDDSYSRSFRSTPYDNQPATFDDFATIVEFSDNGKKLRKIRVPKVVKTEAEWKNLLSPNAFDITRNADTEMAFTGKYWNLHENGLYRCICCDNALFDSDTKFESGTGWPSFWAPHCGGKYPLGAGYEFRDGAHRGELRFMRRASGPCV